MEDPITYCLLETHLMSKNTNRLEMKIYNLILMLMKCKIGMAIF